MNQSIQSVIREGVGEAVAETAKVHTELRHAALESAAKCVEIFKRAHAWELSDKASSDLDATISAIREMKG